MTYLYFRDPDNDLWSVASVDAQGTTHVLETFDTARLARARTLSLRTAEHHSASSGQEPLQSQAPMMAR
jgi:hypothetical protein